MADMAHTANVPTGTQSNRRRSTGTRANARVDPLPIPPGPHRRAGRKRGLRRGMRRFESALGRVDLSGRLAGGSNLFKGMRASAWHLSKLAAAAILAVVVTALVNIHTQEEWFVYAEDVHFAPMTYLDGSELYTELEIEGWNILWMHPATVREQLLGHDAVIDAQVRLALPASVEVSVTERQPVALWVTNQGAYRVAENGIALSRALSPEEIAASPAAQSLPQIVDPLQEAQHPGITEAAAIDAAILTGALNLIAELPRLDNQVRYNRDVGFNFRLAEGNGWVYWGDGLHTDTKQTNLTAALQYMAENAIENRIVDVRFINRPYLR